MPGGSLTVAGTGIQLLSQLPPEARSAIETADLILCDGDAATLQALRAWNPRTESLEALIDPNQPRQAAYLRMVDRILGEVRRGARVCAVFYGHPGVFVFTGHEAVRRCRAEGLPARMLPGISAEDCLFADLGLDPGIRGCQSHEATEFLALGKVIDPASPLLLWQVGMLGVLDYRPATPAAGIRILLEVLVRQYPADHRVTLYQAAQFPVCPPLIHTLSLQSLPEAAVSPFSTLYIPPVHRAAPDPVMARRLGIPLEAFGGLTAGGPS